MYWWFCHVIDDAINHCRERIIYIDLTSYVLVELEIMDCDSNNALQCNIKSAVNDQTLVLLLACVSLFCTIKRILPCTGWRKQSFLPFWVLSSHYILTPRVSYSKCLLLVADTLCIFKVQFPYLYVSTL